MTIKRYITSSHRSQQGVVAVFATLAMVVLIGAGALALDVGNLILSKGKLQNLADTAALSAAKELDKGSSQTAAENAGNQTIADNLALNGYNSLSVDSSSINYEFSEELPFKTSSETTGTPYVRVRIENVDIPDFLVSIFNIDMAVRASAVAGPSTTLAATCNIVPLSVCQGPDTGKDGNNVSGYKPGSLHVLKASKQKDSSIGPGNFMPMVLLDADGKEDRGGDAYKQALAGDYKECMFSNEKITSEPGDKVGPSRAIDSRFFETKLGQKTYYPDNNPDYDEDNPVKVTNNIDGNGYQTIPAQYESAPESPDAYESYFDEYMDGDAYKDNQDYDACLDGSCGADFRRILTIPIIDCDGIDKPGRTSIDLKGFACFFLVQPLMETDYVGESEGEGQSSWIIGEFIKNCSNYTGEPGLIPNEHGPYKIVLYKDPNSEDS